MELDSTVFQDVTPKQNEPNDLIEKAKLSESQGTSNFMDPKPRVGKKRGPKPKSEKIEVKSENKDSKPENPAFNIPTQILCIPFARGVSSLGVNYIGDPRAGMTAGELNELATAMGLVLDKYMPDIGKNYGPELMLSFALGQYGIRLMAMKKLQNIERAKNDPSVVVHAPNSPSQANETQKQDATVHLDKLVENETQSIIP